MESTLALTKSEIEAEIGLFLGYGRGANFDDTEWSEQQQAVITSCVKSGLRRFYFCGHDWSFLSNAPGEVTLESGNRFVDLMDDFGGIQSEITVATSDGPLSGSVKVTGEGKVRQCFTDNSNATGQPMWAAIVPRRPNETRGSRLRFYVYPEADDNYTLTFAYQVLGNCLDGTHPYAFGGAGHAETILESCLAIAEQRLDDSASVHSAAFQGLLAQSIQFDRKQKPQHLGYMGNGARDDQIVFRALPRIYYDAE